jgi:protein-tyrosine phosphatase
LKIKEKLKEIMMKSKDDYGSMSSVHIRQLLEKELELKLDTFKKFIDATIFQFYNQFIECATKILDHLFLGTEWNASNYDALSNDRVTHILNVSSEVDNFFLDTFKYLNIRVLDIDETDLMKEFDRANKFIQEAKEQGTCCLVHCKMGVSRSASIVLAYLMKENSWTLEQAYQFAKQRRACINPNDGFRQQLKTYESILQTKNKAINNFYDPTAVAAAATSTPSSTTQVAGDERDSSKTKATTFEGCNPLKCSTAISGSTISLPSFPAAISPKGKRISSGSSNNSAPTTSPTISESENSNGKYYPSPDSGICTRFFSIFRFGSGKWVRTQNRKFD